MRIWSSLRAAALLGGALLAASGCAAEQSAAGASFEPATPDVLTVATALVSAPGFWEGNPPTSGFEGGLAAALAQHLHIDHVAVVQVPFAEIVDGHLGGADIALSQLTPTSERERSLEFTTPYLTAAPGILVRRPIKAADAQDLRGLHWVVSRTSTLTPIVMHRIRPTGAPIVVEDRTEALDVLRAGRADALLLDLPVALGLARAESGRFRVVGQLSGGEGLAVALPKGSQNLEIVDSAVRALQADGTIDRLVSSYIGESLDNVPLILTED